MRRRCLGKNRWHLEKLGAVLEKVFSCRLGEDTESSFKKEYYRHDCEKLQEQAKVGAAQRDSKK